jgi:plastocyanin domain-containing protein
VLVNEKYIVDWAIALGGLSLIGAQLWCFLGSKPKSQKAEMSDGVQEVTITVDGGYVPSLVTVKRGQPGVHLRFAISTSTYRKQVSINTKETYVSKMDNNK